MKELFGGVKPKLRGTHSLDRTLRLRRADEIQALFQRGTRIERPSFVMLWQAAGDGPRRVVFAVGRRVGGAVHRNRARRRLREAYRRVQDTQLGGSDVAFVGRPLVLTVPFPVLVEEVRGALAAISRPDARKGKRTAP
ncbi:MAG: ribonuclease P protein component [Candidatus Rokuibacteriota bacterium]|nr:MAG: ribonuclease P protein component [Candidatus Rokubacteria bacterium]